VVDCGTVSLWKVYRNLFQSQPRDLHGLGVEDRSHGVVSGSQVEPDEEGLEARGRRRHHRPVLRQRQKKPKAFLKSWKDVLLLEAIIFQRDSLAVHYSYSKRNAMFRLPLYTLKSVRVKVFYEHMSIFCLTIILIFTLFLSCLLRRV